MEKMNQGFIKNICHLQKMNCINDTTTILSLNNDVLCNIVHRMLVKSMQNLIMANKRFYEHRKIFIESNKIIIDFEKTMHMSYFDTFYNSHIISYDDVSIKYCDKLISTETNNIYNTQMMISYIIKPDDFLSFKMCNDALFDYIEMTYRYNYKNTYTPKIYRAYCEILHGKQWWKCKISLYNIYECICLTKQRNYKQLQYTLNNMQIGKTDSEDSFIITFALLLDCVNINYDSKTRAVVTYIIYNYIEHAFEYMKQAKRTLIDAIINKCD